MRYRIAILLLVPFAMIAGGIIKYNVELNRYINQDPAEYSSSRNEINETEVYVIGTVHFETDKIKKHHLYNLVDSISPSIVLYEGDSKTVKRMLRKTDYLDQLITVFRGKKKMEKPVVLKYVEKCSNCTVLPYEWEIRDEYHRKHEILSKPTEIIRAMYKLSREGKLTAGQSTVVNTYLELSKIINETAYSGTLFDINNLALDSIIEKKQYYQYKEIAKIVNDRSELSEYLDFIQIYTKSWDIRNKAMAQNILKQVQLNPGIVIVVLTGFSHRYYLIDELNKYEEELKFNVKTI